jgi:hypothetical protein
VPAAGENRPLTNSGEITATTKANKPPKTEDTSAPATIKMKYFTKVTYTGWAKLKIVVIVFLTIGGVVPFRLDSTADAWRIGLVVTVVVAVLELFQMCFWFFYDVITLKRDCWVWQPFGKSPFAKESGPGFQLDVEAVALLTFGVAKVISAIFQGLPSLALGISLLVSGGLLLTWQKMLRRLFNARFAGGMSPTRH